MIDWQWFTLSAGFGALFGGNVTAWILSLGAVAIAKAIERRHEKEHGTNV